MIIQLNVSILTSRPSVRIVICYVHMASCMYYSHVKLQPYDHLNVIFIMQMFAVKMLLRMDFLEVYLSTLGSDDSFCLEFVCKVLTGSYSEHLTVIWKHSPLHRHKTLQSCILSPFLESFQDSIDVHSIQVFLAGSQYMSHIVALHNLYSCVCMVLFLKWEC